LFSNMIALVIGFIIVFMLAVEQQIREDKEREKYINKRR
jgi:preprotein translocase subunit YajC